MSIPSLTWSPFLAGVSLGVKINQMCAAVLIGRARNI